MDNIWLNKWIKQTNGIQIASQEAQQIEESSVSQEFLQPRIWQQR